MPLKKNTFKQALHNKQTQWGFWLGLTSPYTAEICAGSGFDWLLIDAEHAPNDIHSVLSQLQAVAPYPTHPVVRPVEGTSAIIKQLLDMGAQSLLIPMVESGEQAKQLVAACNYPPSGIRGVGTALARAADWGRQQDYLKTASDDICLLLQVESVSGLDALEDIVNTEGVDGVFIGPADLAGSMGYLGQPTHPEVKKVIEKSLEVIQYSGKAPGILVTDIELARHYQDCGALFIAVGVDTVVLAQETTTLAKKVKGESVESNAMSNGAY